MRRLAFFAVVITAPVLIGLPAHGTGGRAGPAGRDLVTSDGETPGETSTTIAEDVTTTVEEPTTTTTEETTTTTTTPTTSTELVTSTTTVEESTTTTAEEPTTTTAPSTSTTVAVTAPAAPRSLIVTPVAAGQVRLSWALPTSNGGAAINDYVIERSTNGTAWVRHPDVISSARTSTVTGLSTTARTYFRVSAKNVAGLGPASAAASAIARTAPTAPRSLTATPAASGQVRLVWFAPISNGGATVIDYVIQRSPTGTGRWTTVTDGVNTATAYTVRGLANGVRYDFRVLARNVVGSSRASNLAAATPRTLPSAPRSLVASAAGSGRVRLSWLAPSSSGGATIVDYVIQRSPTGSGSWTTVADGTSTSTSYTVSGLTNGQRYYFRVIARNAAGRGAASNITSLVPRTAPSAPQSVRALRGSFQATVSWATPASSGGAPIVRYQLERSTSPTGPWTRVSSSIGPSVRSFTAFGLAYGRRYYFRVAAVNAAGAGPWGAVVSAVPTAPTTTCHPSYPTVCIPWSGADLDCGDIVHRRFAVITPPAPHRRDPHRFDADADGLGCETG